MIYYITERLAVDDEVGFAVDIDRCVELINCHRNVAVGTGEEAVEVLRRLGMTDGSIATLFDRATGGHMELLTKGAQYALPR